MQPSRWINLASTLFLDSKGLKIIYLDDVKTTLGVAGLTLRHDVPQVPLTLGGSGFLQPPIDEKELKKLQLRLNGWQEKEDTKKENARTKNDLESYILSVRELLDVNTFLQRVSLKWKTTLQES